MSVSATLNCDWQLGNNQDGIVEGNQEIIQDIETLLRQWRGTWFVNLNEGVNWGLILGSPNNQDRLRRTVITQVLSVFGVLSIDDLTITVKNNRRAAIEMTITTAFSDQLTIDVEIQ